MNNDRDPTRDSPPAKRASKSPRVEKKTCTFYVPQKNRNCSLLAMKGLDFCAEHASNDGLSPDSQFFRVECPFSSNHTCFARQLQQHIKRCNYRPLPPEPYFIKDLNTVSLETNEAVLIGKSLVQMDAEELQGLINKIQEVFNAFVPQMENKAGSFQLPEIQEQLSDPLSGKNAKRHIQQNSALLHLLDNAELLKESTCFVEFGSGKGGLTYWLARALETKISNSTKTCYLLLVDRESHRHKRENKLDETKFNVERVRIDIKDLKLDAIPCARDAQNLVGVCKHLCGDATDMALRCLMETNSMAKKNLTGLVMATCCHHRCTWKTHVGQQFLKEWGIEEKDFKPLACVTSWAVCGTGRSGFCEHQTEINTTYQTMDSLNLSTAERRMLGTKAKQILDYARCCFIRKHSLNSVFTTFIKSEETLENIAIVGSRGDLESSHK